MGIKVQRHQHDPPATFAGEGAIAQQLVIQTGTIIFEFGGHPNDWHRDTLTVAVLKLPPASLLFKPTIEAIATAVPTSMDYWPPEFIWCSGTGRRPPHDTAMLKRSELPRTGRNIGAGWAVDRTAASRSGDHRPVADVAVFGHSSLMRLAYSVFVLITPATTIKAELKPSAGVPFKH